MSNFFICILFSNREKFIKDLQFRNQNHNHSIIYDLKVDNGKNLIYSVQSQSFDQSSISKLAREYCNKIIKDMAKQGFLRTSCQGINPLN